MSKATGGGGLDKTAHIAEAAVKKVGGEPKSDAGAAIQSATAGAASGAIKGASKGGLQGAAVGAVAGAGKNVAAGKLGVGGSSAARTPTENDGSVAKAGGGNGAGATAAVAAVPVAVGAGKAIQLMMLLNWMKTMFMAALAAASNMVNAVVGAILAGAKALLGGLAAVGASLSAALGGVISAGVATASVVTAAVAAVGLVAGLIVTGQAVDTARRDGAFAECSVNVKAASTSADIDPTADSIRITANAKLIYSVLSAWGMPDENIAGILGNWSAESGVDPTRVQNSENSPYVVSAVEQTAAENTDNGIGLGQWTFGRNQALRDYSDARTTSWGSISTQLGFMISADEGSNAEVVKGMIDESQGSPGGAAEFFHDEWERSADSSMDKRRSGAESWFAQMGGWEANQTLANSILKQSDVSLNNANSASVKNAYDNCLTADSVAGLQQGGMNLEQAQAFMENYKVEGEAKLAAVFGTGGPGTCSGGKADNCVGFSSYFMYEFTTFKQFAPGNGVDTASSAASMNDLETTRIPTVYSVFSKPTNDKYGHTGVILGIEGDMAIIGEAVCDSNHGKTRAYMKPLADITNNSVWEFVDLSTLLVDPEMAS
jgi:hypothetical protein